MTETMTALSVRQPWAEMIVKGVKPIEIRTWRPSDKHIGKRILIHAGKTPGDSTDDVVRLLGSYKLHRGAIIGSAVLTGFRGYYDYAQWVIDQKDHWNELDWYKEGLYGFVFDEAIEFEEPFCHPGKLGFFEVTAYVIDV